MVYRSTGVCSAHVLSGKVFDVGFIAVELQKIQIFLFMIMK